MNEPKLEVFWDASDPQNEGLAYRTTWRDEDGRVEREESGPIDGLADLRKFCEDDPQRARELTLELIECLRMIVDHRPSLSAEARQGLHALLNDMRRLFAR